MSVYRQSSMSITSASGLFEQLLLPRNFAALTVVFFILMFVRHPLTLHYFAGDDLIHLMEPSRFMSGFIVSGRPISALVLATLQALNTNLVSMASFFKIFESLTLSTMAMVFALRLSEISPIRHPPLFGVILICLPLVAHPFMLDSFSFAMTAIFNTLNYILIIILIISERNKKYSFIVLTIFLLVINYQIGLLMSISILMSICILYLINVRSGQIFSRHVLLVFSSLLLGLCIGYIFLKLIYPTVVSFYGYEIDDIRRTLPRRPERIIPAVERYLFFWLQVFTTPRFDLMPPGLFVSLFSIPMVGMIIAAWAVLLRRRAYHWLWIVVSIALLTGLLLSSANYFSIIYVQHLDNTRASQHIGVFFASIIAFAILIPWRHRAAHRLVRALALGLTCVFVVTSVRAASDARLFFEQEKMINIAILAELKSTENYNHGTSRIAIVGERARGTTEPFASIIVPDIRAGGGLSSRFNGRGLKPYGLLFLTAGVILPVANTQQREDAQLMCGGLSWTSDIIPYQITQIAAQDLFIVCLQ